MRVVRKRKDTGFWIPGEAATENEKAGYMLNVDGTVVGRIFGPNLS